MPVGYYKRSFGEEMRMLVFSLSILAALFALLPSIALGCYNSTLLQPDYVIDERNVSARTYPLIQNRFNTLVVGCTPLGREVVFRFVPLENATYVIETGNNGLDTVLSLAGPDGCILQCNDDVVPTVAFNSRVAAQLVARQRYSIVVEVFEPTAVGNISLSISTQTSRSPSRAPSSSPSKRPTLAPVTLPPALAGLNGSATARVFSELVNAIENAREGRETTIVVEGEIIFPMEDDEVVRIGNNKQIRLVGLGRGSSSSLVLPMARSLVPTAALTNLSLVPIGDFNGDGSVDFAFINHSSLNDSLLVISVLASLPSFREDFKFTFPRPVSSVDFRVFEVGDVNGDGFDEFALCGIVADDECHLVMGGGIGATAVRLGMMGKTVSLSSAGDVDG